LQFLGVIHNGEQVATDESDEKDESRAYVFGGALGWLIGKGLGKNHD
jgi:hypothetical protein